MSLLVDDVRKSLGGRRVLDEVSFECARGEITVLTGHNGAGKSTLLEIVAGIMEPDRGTVTIAGRDLARDPRRARQALGYVPEAANPPGHMSANELFDLVRALKGAAPLADELREQLGIEAVAGQRIARLSLGERRRVCLAAALIGEPSVLVLDEPTNGIDASGLVVLSGLLQERKSAGAAVLMATHDAGFAAELADMHLCLENGCLLPPEADDGAEPDHASAG